MKPSKVAVSAGGSLFSALLSFLPLTCCIFPITFSSLGAGGLALAMLLTSVLFAGAVLAQTTERAKEAKTVTTHIDGFMKSRSGAI